MTHNAFKFFFAYVSGNFLSPGFKRIDHVDSLALIIPGLYASAIQHNRRAVQPSYRDEAAGHVFITTRNRDECIVVLCARIGFNAICNNITTHKAVAHSVGSHAYSIAHSHRIKA